MPERKESYIWFDQMCNTFHSFSTEFRIESTEMNASSVSMHVCSGLLKTKRTLTSVESCAAYLLSSSLPCDQLCIAVFRILGLSNIKSTEFVEARP